MELLLVDEIYCLHSPSSCAVPPGQASLSYLILIMKFESARNSDGCCYDSTATLLVDLSGTDRVSE